MGGKVKIMVNGKGKPIGERGKPRNSPYPPSDAKSDELPIQVAPHIRAMLRLGDPNLRNLILHLEMATEIKDKIEGLMSSDKVVLPVRKKRVQILLPEGPIQIPLEGLFAEKENEIAHAACRLTIFREFAAWGCFKHFDFPSNDSGEITLMRGSINEDNFLPIYKLLMRAYKKRANAIRRLAEGSAKYPVAQQGVNGTHATGVAEGVHGGVQLPHAETRGRDGYFVIGGEKPVNIKISRASARPYKLLDALFHPHIGAIKTVASVFEGIRIEKDKTNGALHEFGRGDTARATIIRNTAGKLLSKVNKNPRGTLSIRLSPRKDQCRAEWKWK